MSSKLFYAGSALLVIAATASSSFVTAQDKEKSSADRVPHYRTKQILGAEVRLQDDVLAGNVDDVVVDNNGNVDFFIVVNSNNVFVTVPWDAAKFNLETRTAVLPITQAHFQRAPTYTVEQYPNFSAPAYRTQVYRFFGVTPGQQRRAVGRAAAVVP
jgi:hypothetical protein